MPLIDSEKQFVDSVYSTFQGYDSLKVVYSRVNLATKGFEDVWRVWWSGKLPPKLEIDLVLAFEDITCEIDEALLVGVEVKYFKFDKRGRITWNFYEGLQQALAYTLFGFDGISLWHAFHSDLPDETVRSYSRAMKRLIDEFKLPVFYLATRVIPQGNGIRLEFFAPASLLEPMGLDYIVRWMKDYFTRDREKRNPMRQDREVRRRRSSIKALLQIPV
jgi:hypothetical protein